MMWLIRWIRCKMELGHRLKLKWWPLATAGMSRLSAILYGCQVRERKGEEEVSYFQCDDCKSIIAPFEVSKRGWSYSE